ncbi:hypothetical protein BCR41DRAFT_124572 [Lobosporangium transversale]|uniref:Uncharacterized protein n=1 Tax=Lobosporangium transversale TaxID=64571 RepID=A0A1Y2H037_9FUNG|nr:hypothetical protein BCR41DRAFT_124572 [Lobosporangium transversale]ORZ27919.1 hypothetical protein BCR41DRAFT_124572 [Lobosporangium transversale]|eukprot:XP_021885622.1 hypothetical protein BCR41DRAFT_124572 [Lobosporangium transversale]
MLAVEARDGRIYLHDSKGKFREALVNEPVIELSQSAFTGCVISWAPKPQRLYFAKGNKVMTWDSVLQRVAESFELSSRINALAINTEDILFAVGQTTGSIDVINRATGSSARLETPTSLVVNKLEYSVFSKSILGGVGSNDGSLRLWNTGESGSTAIYHSFDPTHKMPITGMAFSPFNRYLICTVGQDKRYALYDVEKKKVIKATMTDYALTSVSFKNDGVSLAFGTDQGKVLLYDLRSTNRPISIVDTMVDAPVTAVHFQGKPSSSMKRHQTIALNRQNPTTEIVKSSVGKNTSKTALDMFLVKHTTSDTAGPMSAPAEEKLSFKLKRPTVPAQLSTSSSALLGRVGASGTGTATGTIVSTSSIARSPSKSIIHSISGPTFSASSIGMESTPTTPVKEHPNQGSSGSYPNSRTVSPFAFQTMQSQPSPTGESSASSPSVNSPPGSPGFLSSATATPATGGISVSSSQSHLKHYHYQYPSVDSTSKSPLRSSRAKRRKSLGALLASGGTSSPGSLYELSDEKMEILRGQIVDRVRNVLLDPPTTETTGGGSQSNSSDRSTMKSAQEELKAWQKSVQDFKRTSSTMMTATALPVEEPGPKLKAPIKDLWMQIGFENKGGDSPNLQSPMNLGASLLGSVPPSSSSIPMNGTEKVMEATTATTTTKQTSGLSASPFSIALNSGGSFPSKLLEGVIENCLMEFRAGLRNDIQNMHLELLRQFQIQKIQIEGLLKQYTDTRELKEENERLMEENRRLRMNF